jgi:hypothetical protein
MKKKTTKRSRGLLLSTEKLHDLTGAGTQGACIETLQGCGPTNTGCQTTKNPHPTY